MDAVGAGDSSDSWKEKLVGLIEQSCIAIVAIEFEVKEFGAAISGYGLESGSITLSASVSKSSGLISPCTDSFVTGFSRLIARSLLSFPSNDTEVEVINPSLSFSGNPHSEAVADSSTSIGSSTSIESVPAISTLSPFPSLSSSIISFTPNTTGLEPITEFPWIPATPIDNSGTEGDGAGGIGAFHAFDDCRGNLNLTINDPGEACRWENCFGSSGAGIGAVQGFCEVVREGSGDEVDDTSRWMVGLGKVLGVTRLRFGIVRGGIVPV